jgi:hypothetical protein
LVNLPRTKSFMSRSKYVSISPGITNSKSLISTEAIGLYCVSVVSRTASCTGFYAKTSNLVHTNPPIAAMVERRMMRVKKNVPFSGFGPLVMFTFFRCRSLTFAALSAELTYQILR